ncbi:MAG TPA: LuxR C-terminal-related transcriptional regulator [Amycolatopsis sp.]|jgi:DNA-binding NarL/FixJ family response regulator|nr:LuxR C-terminal-related transcriptional regulator [Amycolatopsis sp.]
MRVPTVAILAQDRITADGAAAYLRNWPEIELLPTDQQVLADVILVLATDVTDATLERLEKAAAASVNEDMRIVLVCDNIRRRQLLRAVGFGLVSVLPRRESGAERIVRAALDSRRGQPDLSAHMVGWLIDQARTVQRDVLQPRGLTVAGLEHRELDVVKLLAEGMDTTEIATRLNYSERTVKSLIHGMSARLGLRNRPHMVAYAMRCGAL